MDIRSTPRFLEGKQLLDLWPINIPTSFAEERDMKDIRDFRQILLEKMEASEAKSAHFPSENLSFSPFFDTSSWKDITIDMSQFRLKKAGCYPKTQVIQPSSAAEITPKRQSQTVKKPFEKCFFPSELSPASQVALDVLGIQQDRSFTLSELKRAFRQLAKAHHPDVNPHGAQAFQKARLAFDLVSAELKALGASKAQAA